MRIWHISDVHGMENYIERKEDVDMVIFSGDCANSIDKYTTEREILSFLDWFSSLTIPVKIFVAGNHDLAIERNLITREYIESLGIIYLFNETRIINGLKIFGSPYTPTFGIGWAFNMSRVSISRLWDTIEEETDIVITHGPPKGILDLSFDVSGNLEFCGDSSLEKRISKIKPKLVCFGHIHNSENIRYNSGLLFKDGIIFSNGSCVTDGKFGKPGYLSHGNIINL